MSFVLSNMDLIYTHYFFMLINSFSFRKMIFIVLNKIILNSFYTFSIIDSLGNVNS